MLAMQAMRNFEIYPCVIAAGTTGSSILWRAFGAVRSHHQGALMACASVWVKSAHDASRGWGDGEECNITVLEINLNQLQFNFKLETDRPRALRSNLEGLPSRSAAFRPEDMVVTFAANRTKK
jgi:hypothetical protein